MNLKMLFFPLSITIAFYVAIFYVKPGIDTAITNYQTLSAKQDFSKEVDKKIQNTHDLASNLNANKEDETTVLHYLPIDRDDERVVDGINFLAAQSGLALTSVQIREAAATKKIAAAVSNEGVVGSAAIFAKNNSDITAISSVPVLSVEPKMLSVAINGLGSYESIRDAVNRISHMDRFQGFSSVTIDRSTATTGQPATVSNSANLLNAGLEANFTYLPKVSAVGGVNQPILNDKKFDFSIVQSLKQYISAPVPSMEASASGSTNPFLR